MADKIDKSGYPKYRKSIPDMGDASDIPENETLKRSNKTVKVPVKNADPNKKVRNV